MTSLPPAITLRGIEKIYPASGQTVRKRALHAIDLDIPQGSLFGLLGPNGAGKSTMINIMAGLTIKSSGTVTLWGTDIDQDPRRARASIGIVPQELNIDPFFTPSALLDLQAGLYGIPKGQRRTQEVLAAVGLSDKAHAYARTLSGGMRRRLMVAKAMVHRPPILVLDEPTAGVDVALRQQMWAYIRHLNRQGVTVLLTTHYLEEAQELCDRIAIIAEGRLVACDTTQALLARIERKDISIALAQSLAAVPDSLAHLEPILTPPDRLTFSYRRDDNPVARILMHVQEAGLTIRDISTSEASLEDIFLQLTSN